MAETKLSKKEQQKMDRKAYVAEITPMDPATLADVDYERAKVGEMVRKYKDNVRELAEDALKIDAHEARQLGVAIEVRDIVESSNAMVQLFGIITNLNSNIASDIATIHKARTEFMEKRLKAMVAQEQAEKDTARKAAKATCEKNRRDKAKEPEKPTLPEPEDPAIKEIQEKRYSRPKHRYVNPNRVKK